MAQEQIQEYLGRIAKGDKTCYRALCRLLAKEMLFVPVLYSSSDDDGLTRMKVFAQTFEGRTKIAIFTSSKELEEWRDSLAVQCEVLPLIGVDLGTAVGEEAWLVVNPCRPNQIELSPSWVQFIAMSETKPVLEAQAEQLDEKHYLAEEQRAETQVVETEEHLESGALQQELSGVNQNSSSHSPIKRKRLLLVQEHLAGEDQAHDTEASSQAAAVSKALSFSGRQESYRPPSSAMLYPQALMKFRRSRRRQFIEFLKSIW